MSPRTQLERSTQLRTSIPYEFPVQVQVQVQVQVLAPVQVQVLAPVQVQVQVPVPVQAQVQVQVPDLRSPSAVLRYPPAPSMPQELHVLRDGTAAVVCDARALPIVFVTWFGEPTEKLVDAYYDWHGPLLTRVKSAGGRLALVTDTFATDRPTPKVRKRIVERLKRLGTDATTHTVVSTLVVENAVIRSVLVALSWIDAQMADSVVVSTPAKAVETCFAALDRAGVARPAGLTPAGYARPVRP